MPGTKGGYGDVVIHADYTHSLVGAIVIALTFGLVTALPWGKRAHLGPGLARVAPARRCH